MIKNLQNSLAITWKYHLPEAFITVTANAKWPEVMDALLPGQTPQDKPDLVTQLFHLKVEQLINHITKDGILYETVAQADTIEF